MKKLLVLITLIMALAIPTFAGDAEDMATARNKGWLVNCTYGDTFTYALDSKLLYVKAPAGTSLNMIATIYSSGVKVSVARVTNVATNGTLMTAFNPHALKTNWFDIKAYSGAQGFRGVSTTNIRYWLPAGNITVEKFYIRAGSKYFIRLDNLYSTNARYGMVLSFYP